MIAEHKNEPDMKTHMSEAVERLQRIEDILDILLILMAKSWH